MEDDKLSSVLGTTWKVSIFKKSTSQKFVLEINTKCKLFFLCIDVPIYIHHLSKVLALGKEGNFVKSRVLFDVFYCVMKSIQIKAKYLLLDTKLYFVSH